MTEQSQQLVITYNNIFVIKFGNNIMKSLPNDWHMFNDDGNRAVTLMMLDLKHLIPKKPLPKVHQQLHEQMEKVAKQHGEVYDTEVREAISRCLTQWACEVHELKANCCISHTYWGLL